MNALRESFFSALRDSAKCEIQKSAPLMAVRNGRGDVMGFATAEPVSPDEVERLTDQLDGNKVFDDERIFPVSNRLDRETVSKSVPDDPTDPNGVMSSLFPFVDVAKSADGVELMNRVAGKPSESKGDVGRPRTAKGATPISRFDPANPATVIEFKGDKIVAGSVLEVVMPDATSRFVVLMSDCDFDELG